MAQWNPGTGFALQPQPRARPKVKLTKGQVAGRVAIVVVLLATLGGVIVAIRTQLADQQADKDRLAFVREHSGTPQRPPSPTDVIEKQAESDRTATSGVQRFCSTREPVPAQPAYVPGNLDQWFYIDGIELDARTMTWHDSEHIHLRATTLIGCVQSLPPVPASGTCNYYPVSPGVFGTPDTSGAPRVRTLQREHKRFDVYELRTGKRLAGDEFTGSGTCPDRVTDGFGPVTVPVLGGLTKRWAEDHLTGGTIH